MLVGLVHRTITISILDHVKYRLSRVVKDFLKNYPIGHGLYCSAVLFQVLGD